MIRYITRHGQVADTEFIGGHMFPAGDKPLSELGREQARLLGAHMASIGFCGIILSSPYLRTMETAEIVAEETGCEIIPYAPIREIIRSEKTAATLGGLSLGELREKFPHISADATLEYPWWPPVAETVEDVYARVAAALPEVERLYSDREVLFVGHGASLGGLIAAYNIPRWSSRLLCNCSLSAADPTSSDFKPIYADTSFMPYEICTSNFLKKEEFDAEFFARPYTEDIPLPSEASEISGEVLLHISDTPSRLYSYYERLINEVRPSVILHTGDLADEVKVGRHPNLCYEYLSKVKVILDIMRKSGARVIIVPGNNDLADEIANLAPEAEIYPSGSVVEIDGEECRVGHSVYSMTYDKKWCFYGHGSRGDDWSFENNRAGELCRFNACGSSYICSLSEGRFFKIPQSRLL